MDMYRRNYWSLFLDFIDAFQELSYEQIPLPLLIYFHEYVHVDNSIKSELFRPETEVLRRNKIDTEQQIQPAFERYLKSIRKPLVPPQQFGRTLLCMGSVLRFPDKTIMEHFSPSDTILFASWDIQTKHYLGFPIHPLGDYWVEADELIRQFTEKAASIFSSYNWHPVFGNPLFQKKLLQDIPLITKRLTAIHHYFEQVPISCVIVGTTEFMIERMLVVAAAARGIASICMQHGAIMGEPSFMPVFATVMAVHGKYEQEWYRKRGVPANSVEVTGHPRFDAIFTRIPMSKPDFQSKLRISPDKQTVLVITQDNDFFWPEFIELLAQETSIETIVKPHPSEVAIRGLLAYEKLAAKYESVKLIRLQQGTHLFDVELYDLIPNVDVVVVSSSTVGLETMLFEKPVVFLGTLGDYYAKETLGDFVQEDPQKVIEIIKELRFNNSMLRDAEVKRKQFLSLTYPHQLSGERITDLVQRLTGRPVGN